MKLEHEHITEGIIGSAFEVYNELGFGFLEKVYQRALQVELKNRDFEVELESPIKVKYKDVIVGDFSADLIVNKLVIVELKVAEKYNKNDEPQLLNELKATGIKVGLLLNFGKEKVQFKRFIY